MDAAAPASRRKHLLTLVKLGLAFGLIAWLITSGRIDLQAFEHISGSGWGWMGLAFVVIFGCINLTVVRFRLLLESQGVHLSYRQAFRLTFLGLFFNTMMPGAVGGDVVKAFYIVREQPARKAACGLTVFVDRFVGLAGLITLGTTVALTNLEVLAQRTELLALVIGVAGALVAGVVGFLVIATPRFRELRPVAWLLSKLPLQHLLEELHDSLVLFRTEKRAVLTAFLLSVAAHSGSVLACVFLGQALGSPEFGLIGFFSLIPLGLLIRAIPLTPGSIGLSEVVFGWLFTTAYGWPLGEELSILLYLVQTGWNLFGVVFYVANRGKVEEARTLAREETAAGLP